MPSHMKKSEGSHGRSDIACHSCRRRKVKCDRRLPQCLVCKQTSQTCDYPPGPLKPGPKIGSLGRWRKRSRKDDDADDGERDTANIIRDRIMFEVAEHPIPTFDPASEVSSPEQGTIHLNHDTQMNPVSSEDEARQCNIRRIPDLSFTLHPSHEGTSPETERRSSSRWSTHDTQGAMEKAYFTLGLTHIGLEQLIETYFDNMVAINLFHEPSFAAKMNKISSPTQILALLAAMLSFAIRFYEDEKKDIWLCTLQGETHQQSASFLNQALKSIDEALEECGDHTPPLCILQASIIAAFCQLSQGVLGRAWRSLGTCVRLAYEMNLHLVDTSVVGDVTMVDADQWCEDEEKRRAWWAVWEMDVFASTIRRTPPAVAWFQIETLLPVEDEQWFQRQPRPSCFLQRDLVYRWKTLRDSGNQSPKAWYIVINSLVKDAQQISSPRGVPSSSANNGQLAPPADNRGGQQEGVSDARQRLEAIANAVQCFRLALPNHLKYHDQYLGFNPRVPGQHLSMRQMHCSIYNIYMMTQLAKLMIYRYDVFNGHSKRSLSTQRSSNPHEAKNKKGGPQDRKNRMESFASKQYFDAADDMLTIVHRSCDDHIRYINPFLSNTIWLASAVQLVRSRLCQSEVERSATKSRFEVMHLTYKKCVEFWDMHTAVQQNLEMLEEQLEAHRGSSVNRGQDLSTDVFGTCYVQTGRRSLDNQLPNEEPISPAGPESAHSAGVPNGKTNI
ncbi:hypothetical protein N7486_000004 [Penicillium sp. IBT 16267x]|nr:hypothetical protein N7486_000004 [Penicillium sp. IBT 16267x]